MGVKGVVCCPRVHILLADVYYQISGNAIYAYQVQCMHVHVVTPGQPFYGQVMQGRKASSWRFQIGTNRLKETNLTEDIGPPGSLGVGRGADNPTLEKTSHENWRSKTGGRWLAEASDEGQGPHRTVEPMMMRMININRIIFIPKLSKN
jgi:hypothetical protein